MPAPSVRKPWLVAMLTAMLATLGPAVSLGANGAAELVQVPLAVGVATDAPRSMAAGVYLPAVPGPYPVLVYSHGRSGPEERAHTGIPDPRGFVRYWTRRGFAVVAPIRPGYGATGGYDPEDSGVRYDIFGNCWGTPQFERAAAAAGDALASTVAWVRTQPWARVDRIVLMGTSMGGLASIAAGARNPEGVAAIVSFAGGTGGSGQAGPEHSCGSDAMEALMSQYGATTHVPSLWLYAENDTFWGAERPRAWHRAYATGARDSRLVMTAAVRNVDGHQLLGRGSRLWIAPVDQFLGELGF